MCFAQRHIRSTCSNPCAKCCDSSAAETGVPHRLGRMSARQSRHNEDGKLALSEGFCVSACSLNQKQLRNHRCRNFGGLHLDLLFKPVLKGSLVQTLGAELQAALVPAPGQVFLASETLDLRVLDFLTASPLPHRTATRVSARKLRSTDCQCRESLELSTTVSLSDTPPPSTCDVLPHLYGPLRSQSRSNEAAVCILQEATGNSNAAGTQPAVLQARLIIRQERTPRRNGSLSRSSCCHAANTLTLAL